MTLEQWLLVGQLAAVVAALLAIVAALRVGKKDREGADDRAAEDRRIADKRSADDRREADDRAAEDRRAADARAQATHEKADARAELDREAARKLREEQAAPYVVASLEADREDPGFMDLVIRNYGQTAATHVEVAFNPAPTRQLGIGGEQEPLQIPAVFPTLVPGQEWRSFWRSGYDHAVEGVPDRFEVTARYTDSRGNQLETLSVLDFSTQQGRMYLTRYGLTDIAKTLRKVDKRDEQRWRAERSAAMKRRDLPPLDEDGETPTES